MKGVGVWFVVLVVWFGGEVAAGPHEGDTYTPKERKALEKFKPLVIPRIPASSQLQKYKDDDLFFVQWLRFKELNVKRAERMFLRHLKWRESLRMDTVFEEDWTGIAEDFPIFSDGLSKDGSPVVEAWVGEFKSRTAVLDGKLKAAQRYVVSVAYEKVRRRLFEGRAAGNKNISQGVILVDAQDFNLIEQGCPLCLPLYSAWALTLENHYPNLIANIVAVKNPPAFQALLGVAVPLLRPGMRKVVKSIPWRDVWTTYLDSIMDKDQRSVRVDGTLVRELKRDKDVKVGASNNNNNNGTTESLELFNPEDYDSYY